MSREGGQGNYSTLFSLLGWIIVMTYNQALIEISKDPQAYPVNSTWYLISFRLSSTYHIHPYWSNSSPLTDILMSLNQPNLQVLGRVFSYHTPLRLEASSSLWSAGALSTLGHRADENPRTDSGWPLFYSIRLQTDYPGCFTLQLQCSTLTSLVLTHPSTVAVEP